MTSDRILHADKKRGVCADGCTDDTAALQRLLDQGGRTVVFPGGTYKVSKPLRMQSGTRLIADRAAHVILADGAGTDKSVFVLTNANHVDGNDNICVEGGVWDANAPHNPRGEEYDTQAYSGVAINFINVRQLRLANMTVRNPDCFFIRIGETSGFVIEDIRFDGSFIRPNHDGVHIGGFCEDGVIRNLRAISPYATNDDMVALNADDDVERQMNRGMKLGPIRNILIEDVRADSAYTFIRILSQHCLVENIDIRRLYGGARCNILNMGRWRFPAGNGNIRNVVVRDCAVRKMSPGEFRGGGSLQEPLFNIQLKAENVRLENIRRDAGDETVSATLVLEPEGVDCIQMNGLSERQYDSLSDGQNPAGLERHVRTTSGGEHVIDLGFKPQTKVTVGSGDLESFRINPSH